MNEPMSAVPVTNIFRLLNSSKLVGEDIFGAEGMTFSALTVKLSCVSFPKVSMDLIVICEAPVGNSVVGQVAV